MAKRVNTNLFYKLYLNVVSSIALGTTIISVAIFGLSLVTLSIDESSPENLAIYKDSAKDLINPDSARSLLSAIAGGMITLMVFTFTMFMVVLNQISSNYSPRVLPSLIRRRFHQIIMGFYLGTIAYTFMVLSSVESEVYEFDVPILSIIINAVLTFVSLAFFVIFIQSISQNIQIGEIINKIYREAHKSLDREVMNKNRMSAQELPDINQWETVYSQISGYLDDIDESLLVKKSGSIDITIKLLIPIGGFVNQRDAFFRVNRKLSDTEQEEILHAFVFRYQEIVKQNYVYGFKQLTEIAVKALSPGINDPGTAIQAIDRLTDLFVVSLKLSGFPILTDKHEKLRFIYQPASLQDIFYFSFSSIKNYAGSDIVVTSKLLLMIKTLAQNDQEGKLTDLLINSISDAIEQFSPDFRSSSDRKKFVQLIQQLSSMYSNHSRSKEILQKLAALEE